MNSKNAIAKAVSIVGIIEMLAGVIVFIALLTASEGEAVWLSSVALIGGIISGIMFLGFGEIISLLADISNKLSMRQTVGISDVLPRL